MDSFDIYWRLFAIALQGASADDSKDARDVVDRATRIADEAYRRMVGDAPPDWPLMKKADAPVLPTKFNPSAN